MAPSQDASRKYRFTLQFPTKHVIRHPGGHDLVSLKFQAFTTKKFLVLPYSSQSLEDLQPKVMGNYTHYLIYAASSLAEQTYPLALLIDDTDASVSSIHFYGQAGSSHRFFFFGGGVGGGKWTWIVEELVLLLLVLPTKEIVVEVSEIG